MIKMVGRGLQFGLIAIGVILFFMIMAGESTNDDGSFNHDEGSIMGYIMLGEWMMYLCAAIIIIFAVTQIAMNVKQSIPTLIGIGVFALILLMSYYAFASGDLLPQWLSDKPDAINPTEGESKLAGAGLIATYILGTITILGIVAGEVLKVFK